MENGVSKLEEAAEAANTIAGTTVNTVKMSGGQEVTIHICKTKNVGVVLAAVQKLMESLGIKTLGELPATDFTNPSIFLKLIANNSENLFQVASELCSLSLEEFMELELDDSLKVVIQVVTVNKDFFLQRVVPLLPFALPTKQAVKKKSVRKRK